MSHPLNLYFWPTPNGLKISIMLEECGLGYQLKPVNISQGEQFKPDFLKISPNNKIPALVDMEGPDKKSIAVFESAAILLYLARKTGRFYSSAERQQLEIEQWLFWQMGSFGPMLGQAHHFRHFAPEKVAYAITRYTNEAQRLYTVLDKHLSDKEYVCGDYSIADMAIFPWVHSHEKQGVSLENHAHVKTWFETCNARPGVEAGMNVGKDLRAVPAR